MNECNNKYFKNKVIFFENILYEDDIIKHFGSFIYSIDISEFNKDNYIIIVYSLQLYGIIHFCFLKYHSL